MTLFPTRRDGALTNFTHVTLVENAQILLQLTRLENFLILLFVVRGTKENIITHSSIEDPGCLSDVRNPALDFDATLAKNTFVQNRRAQTGLPRTDPTNYSR